MRWNLGLEHFVEHDDENLDIWRWHPQKDKDITILKEKSWITSFSIGILQSISFPQLGQSKMHFANLLVLWVDSSL